MTRYFTLVELMIVVAIIAVLAAIAVPLVQGYQLSAKRAELMPNVDGIKTAEVAFHAAFDGYIANNLGGDPRDVMLLDKKKAAWATGSALTTSLGWAPDGDIYGNYDTFPSGTAVAYVAQVPCFSGALGDGVQWVLARSDVDDNAVGFLGMAVYMDATGPTATGTVGWCSAPDEY